MNNNLLPSDEFIEYEGQFYTNPQKGLEESNTFIDNLRNVQNANNAEINAQTRNLGTAVPSNLGGLIGGEGFWTSRYQTPQTNAVAANLKSAAQYNALMESLQNQTNAWKQRYNNAYRDARKRANTPQGGGGGDPFGTNPENIEQTTTTQEIGDIQTEGIAKSIYRNRFNEYIKQGMTAQEAEIMAKQSLGLAPSTQQNLNRVKSTIGGSNAYVYTLPNGNTVLVNEDKYKLVNAGDQYFLQDLNTKSLTRVGG